MSASCCSAAGAEVVQVDVDAHAVLVRECEDHVEVLLGIAVEPGGVEAADDVGAEAQGLVEQAGDAGRHDDAALREGDDLESEHADEPLAQREHLLEVVEPDVEVDVDVRPDGAGP